MEKLVARSVQRWKSLSPVQKVVFCIAVICATLWGGSKDGLPETVQETESATSLAVGNLAADATVVAATGDASGDQNFVTTNDVGSEASSEAAVAVPGIVGMDNDEGDSC